MVAAVCARSSAIASWLVTALADPAALCVVLAIDAWIALAICAALAAEIAAPLSFAAGDYTAAACAACCAGAVIAVTLPPALVIAFAVSPVTSASLAKYADGEP